MEHFFNIPDGSDLKSLKTALQLHTPTHCDKALAETLLSRRLDRGERIYDRKNVNRCSPLGRDPGCGHAREPDRRI